MSYRWHALHQPAPTDDVATSATTRGTLADYKGKRVLINFWATWCGPCILELPTLDALAKEHPEMVVLAVAAENSAFSTLETFIAELGLKHIVLVQDDTGALLEALGKGGLPITYVMDADGTLRHWYLGATDWREAKHQPVLFPKP